MTWFQGKRVVVPFDFSEQSFEAVKVGLKLTQNPQEVHVLHVLLELPATDPVIVWDTLNDEKRKQATHESMQKKLEEHGIEDVQLNVTIGDPAQSIADLAEEIEAGMIVIPSHGYTGLKRFFLGSVTERVVRIAKCCVLVLKE